MLAGYLALCVLALAGCAGRGDDDGPLPESSPSIQGAWRPSPADVWEIQLDGDVALRQGVDVYDVDIDSEAELVQQMHEAGAKVVCYFDAGGYEDWRDDAASFPAIVLGEAMAGWPESTPTTSACSRIPAVSR